MRSQKLGEKDVTCSNLCAISMVKQAYLSQAGRLEGEGAVDVAKLRFLSMGKELKDEFFLYSYDIVDNMVIQAMLRP